MSDFNDKPFGGIDQSIINTWNQLVQCNMPQSAADVLAPKWGQPRDKK